VAGQPAHGDRLLGRVQQRQELEQGLGQAVRKGRVDHAGERQGPVHQGQDGGGLKEQLQRLVQQAAVLLDRHKLPSVDASQAQLSGPVDQRR